MTYFYYKTNTWGNSNPQVTEDTKDFWKHLVEKKVFENNPLVIVDVGARKGFEKHWDHYKNQSKLIGFEPNEDSYKECVKHKSNEQTSYLRPLMSIALV